MNCFDCKIPCEYSNSLGYCVREAKKEEIAKSYAEKLEQSNPQTEAFDFEGAVMYGYEKAIEKMKETIQLYVEKGDRWRMVQAGDANDQGSFTYWDGFSDCANGIMGELKQFEK